MVALTRGLAPEWLTEEELAALVGSDDGPYEPTRCVLPSLYETWVKRPCMVAKKAGEPDFLGAEDMQPAAGAVLKSVLNATLLDRIKDAALMGSGTPSPASGPRFLSETMHVYITVSNLRGIPFEVNFGNAKYGMLTHGDRVHYAVSGVGTASWPRERWLREDAWIPIDAATLPTTPADALSEEWHAYGEAALASAAFPGGLAPRLLKLPMNQYLKRQYPLPVEPGQITASFPAGMARSTTFEFLNVDGGVVNNTPFDYAQFAIMGFPHVGATNGVQADRAVIMVAPFPESPTVLAEGIPELEFSAVLRALFPTLINQARFRASELIPVMDDDDHSRFMVTPRRSNPGDRKLARFPLACGLLGGFGGFLDEEFRAHDYQLGRRNCQRFLQATFGLPQDNPVIAKPSGRFEDHPLSAADPGAAPKYRLIPLVADLGREVALKPWPRMSGRDFRELMQHFKRRFELVKGPFIRSQTAKSSVRLLARLGLRAQQGRILRFVALIILADLVRRDQIEGWDLPMDVRDTASKFGLLPEDVRQILATMVEPARDACNVDQIATASHLPVPFVKAVLAHLAGVGDDQPFGVVELAEGRYMLRVRWQPGWRSWPVVRQLAQAWLPFQYPYPIER